MINSQPRFRPVLSLILSLIAAGSMWYYVDYIWGANNPPNFSDSYASWWAAHEVLLHRRNPYTPEVAHHIQTVIYGAPVTAASPEDPAGIAGGFAYPLYTVFLLWPTVGIPFSEVRTVLICLFPALTLLTVLLWLSAMDWPFDLYKTLVIAVLAVGSFPSLQAIKLQNLSVIAACLVASAIGAVAANRLTLAGILLATATIKPQFVVLLIPWLALWSTGDWPLRRRLIWSFSASMSVLLIGSELILPGWMSNFLKIVRAYKQYTYGHSLLELWFGARGGMVAAVVIVLTTLRLAWNQRKCEAKSPFFFLATSSILAATVIVIPTMAPHCQLLLLPGFLLLLCYSRLFWEAGSLGRLLSLSSWILLAWPWLAAALMTAAALWTPPSTLLRLWMVPLYSSPLVPLGTLASLVVLFNLNPGNSFPRPIGAGSDGISENNRA